MPSHRSAFFRLVLPLALLAALLAFVDLRQAARLLASASLPFVLLAVALVQVQILLAAVRWRITAKSLGQKLGWWRAVTEYYGASLLNLVLPGGVSGDVVRVLRNREDGSGAAAWERPAQAVFLERVSGQVAFAIFAAAGVAFWIVGSGHAPREVAAGNLALFALGLLALLTFLGGLAFFAPGSVRAAVRRLGSAARLAFLRPRHALIQLVLSLAIVAAYLAVFSLASRAVGAPLDLRQTLLVVPPVLLTMVVPVSIGGWGVRETAAAALWPLVGSSASAGVAASVLYGLLSTVGALPGLLTFDVPRPGFPFGASVRHQASERRPEDEERRA